MPQARVQTPDGRVMTLQVPEGATEQQILDFARQQFDAMQDESQATPAASPTFGRAFGNAALNQFMNNVLGIPEAAVNLGLQVASTSPIGALGERAGVLPEGSGQPLGDPGHVRLGLPSATDIRAGIETAGSAVGQLAGGQLPNIGETFEQERVALEAARESERQGQPVATAIGELAGSAATLATGRIPVGRAGRAPTPRVELPTELGRVASRAINSQGVQSVIRGTGRSVETGLEGLVLSVLEGGDPAETAAFAAGGQAIGSAALAGTKGLLSGGVLRAGGKLALAAGAVTGLVQTVKSLTPGGRDRILESIETGFDKVALGLALGAVAGVVGAGRGSDSALGRAAPQITDFLASLPRGATLGALNDVLADSEAEVVVSVLAENPDFFGPAASRRLNRALTREDVSLGEEIERLKKDRGFRRKLDSILPR